jgi:3-dehydroquinate synthase
VDLKYGIVSADEQETGDRKLLNFGHTIGHAIENAGNLPHGHAISIGMAVACRISEEINGFSEAGTRQVTTLLSRYGLPVLFTSDKQKTWEILQHDKKKSGNDLSFIVLDEIGKAAVKAISLEHLYKIFNSI